MVTQKRRASQVGATKPAPVKPTQIFDDRGNHCLVAADGRRTQWAGYRQTTMLDGWVGHTAFYDRTEGVVTPKEFCKLTSVTDLVEPRS